MNLTVSQFRSDFPEFSDATAYPDAMISSRLALAPGYVDETRWDASAVLGAELVAAHFLVLAKRAQNGAGSGAVTGVLTSKSVGGVSASYDIQSLQEVGAGMWNATSYGIQYRTLARLFGAGGIQL